MARTDAFCESGEFYCYSLSVVTVEDERDIMDFRPIVPNGAGLVTREAMNREYGDLVAMQRCDQSAPFPYAD